MEINLSAIRGVNIEQTNKKSRKVKSTKKRYN
jgi:hypothetical protein